MKVNAKVTEKEKRKAFITANFHLLRIAMQNILENARKYSKKQVEVYLTIYEDAPVIKIKDYGIGIPEEEIQHIFHSFYRASNTREYSGQGIGLSLSMKIVSV